MVQPKIDSLHEAAGNVAIVVFQKDYAIFQAGFATELVNFLDKGLACFIARMRFACENELHRARAIVRQSL